MMLRLVYIYIYILHLSVCKFMMTRPGNLNCALLNACVVLKDDVSTALPREFADRFFQFV